MSTDGAGLSDEVLVELVTTTPPADPAPEPEPTAEECSDEPQ